MMFRRFATRRTTAVLLACALATLPAIPGPAAAASPVPGRQDLPCRIEQEPNERPEDALVVASEVCLTGTLPVLSDQDLVLWDVLPEEALATWRFTVAGIPTTITSAWLYEIRSEDDVLPLDTVELFRVDSDDQTLDPGVREGVSLPAGRYVLGIARGNPADGSDAPAAEYQVTIEREQSLPPNGDVEPNNEPASATPVTASFALVGAIEGDPDVYRWTLTDADASGRWQVDLSSVQGETVELALQAADGTILAGTRTQSDSRGHLYDLGLPAGSYDLLLSSTSAEPLGYLLSAAPSTSTAWDPEPNDGSGQALPIAIGGSAVGRLAGPLDTDQYQVTIPPEAQGHQFDVGVEVATEADRQVCLVRQSDQDTSCLRGTGDIFLSNRLIAPGEYRITIEGQEDLANGYQLSVTDVGPVTADREVESNDRPDLASVFDPALGVHGRSANDDIDYYRIPILGDTQVWRLDAVGSRIVSLQWVQPDLTIRGTADISADGTTASLWDMALVPGDHWIAIETGGEDYSLTLTPLGVRAQGSEREPNNDAANAEPIDADHPRTGRLPDPADTDVYRFSLGTPEHITLRLDPPSDAAIRIGLSSGTQDLVRMREPITGAPFGHTMELHPGDYEITLQSDSGSTQPYTLAVERQNPFGLVADLEPNDTMATGRPVPASLHVAGRGFGAVGEDDDWYTLPPLSQAAAVTLTTTGDVVLQELRDATAAVGVEQGTDGATWTTATLPAGTQLHVSLGSPGEYTLDVASEGLPAAVPEVPLPVTAELRLATADVAAYTEFGQRVAGTLHVTGAPDEALSLALDSTTTHPTWTMEPGQTRIDVPPGGTAEIPVDIVVARDAWADVPVRVTLRLRDDAGRQATASADVTPRRDVALVAPESWWPVPETMLGGLDVASLALGASIVETSGVYDQELLHDGFAMTGIGFTGQVAAEAPLVFTVDLATDDPVPVTGMIIDPLAQVPALVASPRRVQLLLSQDGVTWQPALDVELSSRQEDQAFALPEPVPARFAQLLVHSTYAGTDSYVNLGEWQVIASPEWQPPRTVNLADPGLGGHVAWMFPGPTDPTQPEGMLSETAESAWAPWVVGMSPIIWAIGFQDDRAAQVTDLEWVDPPGSDPTIRFDEVQVAVSSGSALGPWQELGTWSLNRVADGTVAPFHLPAPTWARFVRISGTGPEDTGYWQMPTTIRVLERPVDGEYRSVLGAWGRGEGAGIFEHLVPPDPSALELAFDLTDGDDTPETATPLTVDEAAAARIRRGEDIDWYSLVVPADDNMLELSLQARPEAGLVVTMQDAAGADVELITVLTKTPGELAFTADVTAGATYHVRVEQAPLSTVFTYDTSGSMGAYLSYVTAALRGFAADVTPGEEAVLVMPFGDLPLLDHWSDNPYEIESAVAGAGQPSGTSAAEASIMAAAKELVERPGARAILVITDAETSSYANGADMWAVLDDVRPVIFTVHAAGGNYPALTNSLMHDWAASWGGHYEYASSHAQIDRAFDRLATWLRRPAPYDVRFSTHYESREPGSLSVISSGGSGGTDSLVAGTGVAVEILLDTSGSMNAKTQGGRRIKVAKDVLIRLVTKTLPPGVPTALRIFKPGKKSCSSQLLAPLGPLDPDSMGDLVRRLKINGGTRTPIAATLREVAADLSAAQGLRIIVLITDGKETCKGDPAQVIRDLVAEGLDVRVNIIGFDIDDEGLRQQLVEWARLGNGQAFDADGADGLEASIAAALAAPFRVLDADGVVVGTGVVGEGSIPLPPGTYRVEILTDPVIVREGVEVPAETSISLTVDPPTSPASPAP